MKTPFKGVDGRYHYIYRVHNTLNGNEYTGKHSTINLDDGYFGSGKSLKLAFTKYGVENFCIEILSFHESEYDAFIKESEIVDEEYIWRTDTYNNKLGGNGGWDYVNSHIQKWWTNKVIVKDKEGNIEFVDINDERYLNGEFVGIMKDRVTVKDGKGNTLSVSVNDEKYKSGEYVHHTKGKSTFKDKTGRIIHTYKNDTRVLSGELMGISKGTTFKMKSIKTITCPHCNKTGRPNNMYRWHFSNCKSISNT